MRALSLLGAATRRRRATGSGRGIDVAGLAAATIDGLTFSFNSLPAVRGVVADCESPPGARLAGNDGLDERAGRNGDMLVAMFIVEGKKERRAYG